MNVKMDIAGELERVNRDIDDMIAHGKKEIQLSFFGGSAEEKQLISAVIDVIKARGFEHELDYEDGEIWLTVRRKETRNMKYQITIKDLETEEIVFNEECDCICGAISGIDGEEVVASTVNYGNAAIVALFTVLAAAQDACDHLEDQLHDSFKSFVGTDAPIGLFREFIDAIKSKGTITRGEEETDHEGN